MLNITTNWTMGCHHSPEVPYNNIKRYGPNTIQVEFYLPGFTETGIKVTRKGNTITVYATKEIETGIEYINKGSQRPVNYQVSFDVSGNDVVHEATLEYGILKLLIFSKDDSEREVIIPVVSLPTTPDKQFLQE